ncbi:MAG: ATP-binding cassette domain-containing protein, partial [Hyphomonadaceae bacterium]
MLLQVDGLRKTFGRRVAVDGIGFSLDVGEIVGFLGPNGAGKTTT